MAEPDHDLTHLAASASRSLAALVAGNDRFAEGRPQDRVVNPARRRELVDGQHPTAVVLGCVDSRVPPELVLDQGVGDLLTVRSAGQALEAVALGSVEFGVRVLGLPLVVVLGHTGCGAVAAAMDHEQPGGALGRLVEEVAERLGDPVGDDPVRATTANVAATVDALRGRGTLDTGHGPAFVVGMVYNLASGRVTVTDDAGLGHP